MCGRVANNADRERKTILSEKEGGDWRRYRLCKISNLRLLTERAALGQTGLTTGGLRENLGAGSADDNGLGVREDGGDGEATGALDVHEERVGVLHKSLELVRASLLLGGGVKKVDGESLMGQRKEEQAGEGLATALLCQV